MSTLTRRSPNPRPFHDSRAEERSSLARKTSISCTQFNTHEACGGCAEFSDGLWLSARDDFSGQSRKRQRQSPPAPSASDAASSQSTGSSVSASSVLAGASSTPFSLSTSDTTSSSRTTTLASSSLPMSSAPDSASSTDFTSTIPDATSSGLPPTTTSTPTSITSTDDPDSTPSSVASPTTTSVITSTSPPLSATTESDTNSPTLATTTTSDTSTNSPPLSVTTTESDSDSPPDSTPTTTTTSDTSTTSPPLSATTDSDTDSPTLTTTTTSDTNTNSPPLSATTTESDSDSPPASTSTKTTASASDISSSVSTTDIPSASSTATSVPATSASDGVSSSDTTSISASVTSISASSIILSPASADPPSSSSAVLSAPPPSHSSIQLSSMEPFSTAAASGSIFSGTTPILSFPSITGADNLASPAPPIQAPTGVSTVLLPSTPTISLDFTSTALGTHVGVAALPGPPSGSLFTTTIVYTSGGSVYTTVSTGVLGTGRPVPHDFAHNVGAIIGVAIGGAVALILIVLAVFCACQRFRPRAHREFMLYGAAKGLRRPRGAWRSPIDGDSVYSLVSESVDDHGDTSLLEAESGMREARASQGYWGSAPPFLDAADISSSHTPDSFTQTPDLISMQDAIWVPTPPSSLSIPALLAADGGRPSDLSIPSRSSLLNPPLAPSSSTVALPSPTTPQPEWPGLRGSITQSLPLAAEPLPSAAESTTAVADPLPSPATTEEPHVAEGLLRPSLTVLQSHSSRTFDDHVDYSRLIGAQRAGSGNTFDTASSKTGSSVQ